MMLIAHWGNGRIRNWSRGPGPLVVFFVVLWALVIATWLAE